ncbi:MAG: hypothetical protein ACLPTJ_12675 [Solirubrobacteraceae bacterium]
MIGAGLGYAWVDFANKLLSNELSSQRWGLASLFIAGVLGFGAVAFLQENCALQTRPVVTVAPVIGAIQNPLPVLMALAAGVEAWSARPGTVAVLLGGLGLATAGAVGLGRSQAVSRISSGGAESRAAQGPHERRSSERGAPAGGATPVRDREDLLAAAQASSAIRPQSASPTSNRASRSRRS